MIVFVTCGRTVTLDENTRLTCTIIVGKEGEKVLLGTGYTGFV